MKNRYRLLFVFTLLLTAVVVLSSCHEIHPEENSKVSFSTDLVQFDTVFTTVGSATQNFRVYNPYNYDIKLDVYLAGGDHSQFSINVDVCLE